MNDIPELLARGLQAHRAGELAEATPCYDQILALDPRQADALHLRGLIHFQQGDLASAMEQIVQALLSRPNVSEFHNSLGAVRRAAGQVTESIASFCQAITLRPIYPEAHNNLGNALRDLGRVAEARECFERALEFQPGFAAARANLEELNRECRGDILEASRQIVLHVGCGAPSKTALHERFRGEEWREVRLDVDPAVRPDIVASIVSMPVVANDSVDAVWSSHNLEHLATHEVPHALGEFHRVLKPGGIAFVTLPDLKQVAELVVADRLEETAYVSPAGPIRPIDCLFGLARAIEAGNDFMAHRTGFTSTTLHKKLEAAGFVDVKVWTSPLTLWAEGRKAA